MHIDRNKVKSLKQQSNQTESLHSALETLLDYRYKWGSPILSKDEWDALETLYEIKYGRKYKWNGEPGRFAGYGD